MALLPERLLFTSSNSTTFNITFSATILGNEIAWVSIARDNPDENPYTFNISGNGIQAGTNPSLTLTTWVRLKIRLQLVIIQVLYIDYLQLELYNKL